MSLGSPLSLGLETRFASGRLPPSTLHSDISALSRGWANRAAPICDSCCTPRSPSRSLSVSPLRANVRRWWIPVGKRARHCHSQRRYYTQTGASQHPWRQCGRSCASSSSHARSAEAMPNVGPGVVGSSMADGMSPACVATPSFNSRHPPSARTRTRTWDRLDNKPEPCMHPSTLVGSCQHSPRANIAARPT